jgi:hypothetical protein
MLRHNYDRYVQKEEIYTTCLPISHNGLPPYKQITPSPLSQSTKDHAYIRSVTPAAPEMAFLNISLIKDPGNFLHAIKRLFYWRNLQKTMLHSTKNSYQKSSKMINLESINLIDSRG